MVAVAVVVGAAVVLALALTLAAWWWARDAHRRQAEVDARLRPDEARTGVCGLCRGKGWVAEVVQLSGHAETRPRACWRCDGAGTAPA